MVLKVVEQLPTGIITTSVWLDTVPTLHMLTPRHILLSRLVHTDRFKGLSKMLAHTTDF